MDSRPEKKSPSSESSISKKDQGLYQRLQSSQVLIKNLCQGQAKERDFEITLHGRLDYRNEVDLAEAKAMLREIAYEIKAKFNRGDFVSRHSEYALIDDAETEIH